MLKLKFSKSEDKTTNQNSKIARLKEILGTARVFENKDLFPYLSLRTKTVAEYYFESKTKEDLQKAIQVSGELKLPIFILGGGSNIAVTQSKIEGLVIRNLYTAKEKVKETPTTVDYRVSSGYLTPLLVEETIEEGLGGLEYQKGLPGTIGGAIYMNAKWTKPLRYFSDLVVGALLLDRQGNFKEVKKEYFKFDYDYSILHHTKEILVNVVLRFAKKNPEVLRKRAKEAIQYRLKTQPTGVASCGCFFRSVGYIIDKLNLKGLTIGDFTISNAHGNFIINKSGKESNPQDLKKLLNIVKQKVKEKYGIELEEEVIIV